jgi:hypothetical protein
MLETIVTSIGVALITSLVAYLLQERKLKAELRTEFMAEQAAQKLLKSRKWKKRSFDEIKKRLAGFDDDELRKILVRSGAVRFDGEKELWGLISKNKGDL